MPGSAIRSFTDPDDYAASIRTSKAALSVVGRGQFEAKITRIDFDRLLMQRFSESLPRIMHLTNESGRAIVSFHTHPGPTLFRSGIAVNTNNIARLGQEQSYFQRSFAAAQWGSMSLAVSDMYDAATALTGREFTPPTRELIVTPKATAFARLRRLHAAAEDLAKNTPEIIANDTTARGLEQALIHAMINCVDTADAGADSSAQRRHEKIMRRFHAAIEERPDEAIYIPDLCTLVGVPERTLRLCCYESLGMGPKRYLLLRRMKLTRQALRRADAAATTVTDIAANFGFWNFGRFAVEYKALYGEKPSTTLRNQP